MCSCLRQSLSEYDTQYQSPYQTDRQGSVTCPSMTAFCRPVKAVFGHMRGKTGQKEKMWSDWWQEGRRSWQFYSSVNPTFDPTDTHFNTNLSPPTATNTHFQSSHTISPNLFLYYFSSKYTDFRCFHLSLSFILHPSTCHVPHPRLTLPVRGEPQAAVWESGEAALKFLQQWLWQNQTFSLAQTNRLK